MTVEELLVKRRNLELDIHLYLDKALSGFRSETGFSIDAIHVSMLDCSSLSNSMMVVGSVEACINLE